MAALLYEAQPRFDTQVSMNRTHPTWPCSLKSHLSSWTSAAAGDNEFIDAGEWVNLQITVANRSSLPYFSSSAFVKANRSASGSLHPEYLFPELPPAEGDSAKKGPTGVVATWVYLSSVEMGSVRRSSSSSRTRANQGRSTPLRASLLVRNRATPRSPTTLSTMTSQVVRRRWRPPRRWPPG